MSVRTPVVALMQASHPGPTIAVTALTALLAAGVGHDLRSGILVTGAVATGQLSIGWSNDLIDADRDRQVRREDKPVARGDVSPTVVRSAIVLALAACVALSVSCGLSSGIVHLALVVGSGWAYNLGLKRTPWSALPYAVAFGALPGVVTLAGTTPEVPALWLVTTGALLGVGAHLLNALPDFDDDARTGVHGWPQRLGARRVRVLAPGILVGASAVTVFGPEGPIDSSSWFGLGICVALGVVAARGRGRVPFITAVAIALIDVASLVLHAQPLLRA